MYCWYQRRCTQTKYPDLRHQSCSPSEDVLDGGHADHRETQRFSSSLDFAIEIACTDLGYLHYLDPYRRQNDDCFGRLDKADSVPLGSPNSEREYPAPHVFSRIAFDFDWAQTVLRQFFFSAYQFLLYQKLQHSNDEQLAAIAAKALKEVSYHQRWSSEWVIRLGDGTEESHQRMLQAIDELWRYTGELFVAVDYEAVAGFDVALLKDDWMKKVTTVFEEATLTVPEKTFMQTGGKTGVHTEHLGYILTELQYMQRTYPNSTW